MGSGCSGARPWGRFVIDDLRVSSTARCTEDFGPERLHDVDDTKVINPGVEKQGLIVFDVPRKDYRLRLTSGVLAWKDEALVQLVVTGG